jgi:hypothetical protein
MEAVAPSVASRARAVAPTPETSLIGLDFDQHVIRKRRPRRIGHYYLDPSNFQIWGHSGVGNGCQPG